MLLILYLISYAPEDSNCQYLLDKQLAHYLLPWEVRFDSSSNVLRTSQGCLDLLNWYIDIETRYEVYLSRLLGLRYQNHYRGDYNDHISNHYFQPFFQLNEKGRLFLSVTAHYYKGEDEIGIGYFYGRNYLNYLEGFLFVEDFDRNFSLQATPNGPEKLIYKDLKYPIKMAAIFNRNWRTGKIYFNIELGTRYHLESTDFPFSYAEEGLKKNIYARCWQDMNKLRIGGIVYFKNIEKSIIRGDALFREAINELIGEPMVAYRLSEKWLPTLYLTYNLKTEDDTGYYRRDAYAYLIDVEFQPGGNFIWHFGTQRQFYYNNQGSNFKERRINLGLEYRFRNIWFYLVEAMEGDFPTPKYLHNHTYVQLMIKL